MLLMLYNIICSKIVKVIFFVSHDYVTYDCDISILLSYFITYIIIIYDITSYFLPKSKINKYKYKILVVFEHIVEVNEYIIYRS